ncbi:MAG: hypothetical protein JWQ87_4279 [Candidatus Sulfotelmatobacter sp.]|nr:hypothetical protein [Candidatus Sulfotelmatobacter sp.]
MSLKRIVRQMLLAFFLGCRAALGIGMSREEIEGILYSANRTKIEITIHEENVKDESK